MHCCLDILTFCAVAVLVLAIAGYSAFRWMFTRKGKTRFVRGPFGIRIEVDGEYCDGGKKTQPAYTYGEKTYNGGTTFSRTWTCTCGASIKPGESRCQSCGKARDQAILEAEYEDTPGGDVDDPLSDNMIDLD